VKSVCQRGGDLWSRRSVCVKMSLSRGLWSRRPAGGDAEGGSADGGYSSDRSSGSADAGSLCARASKGPQLAMVHRKTEVRHDAAGRLVSPI
jgi:hypothetical protein